MTMKYEFVCKDPKWFLNVDDEFQTTIVSGDIGKVIERDSMSDVMKPESVSYDSESDKVFGRTNRLSLVKGKMKATTSWSDEDNITETDIERMLALNENDKVKEGDFTESTSTESVANNEYVFTYKFGSDYNVISPNSNRYLLATNNRIEALEDDTRLFCLRSKTDDYEMDILDISPSETKTISNDYNSNTIKYIYFSQDCKVGETEIDQYSCRKFTSESIEIENTSDNVLRIFLISR